MSIVLSTADLRCPVTGKQAYADEKTATKYIEKAWLDPNWRNVHGRMPQRAYECTHCGWWHMTADAPKIAAAA